MRSTSNDLEPEIDLDDPYVGFRDPDRHPTPDEDYVVLKRLETANSSLLGKPLAERKEHVLRGARVHHPDLLKRFEVIFDLNYFRDESPPTLSVRYRARAAVDRLADLG